MEQDGDISTLLKSIRDLSNKIEESVSPYDTMDDLHKQFFLYRQMPGEDNSTHLTRFKEIIYIYICWNTTEAQSFRIKR